MWFNELSGLTGYPLVLGHYIGTGKLWRIIRFGGSSGGGLTRIHCMFNVCFVYTFSDEIYLLLGLIICCLPASMLNNNSISNLPEDIFQKNTRLIRM